MQLAVLILAGRRSGFAVTLFVIAVHVENVHQGPDQPAWLTILLLSHADKFFTPHQRRLLPTERPLSALFSLLFISPYPVCLFFPSHLTFPSSCASSLLPISCTESQSLSATCKKHEKIKYPSFYVGCISFLCPLSFFSISFYFQGALTTARKPLFLLWMLLIYSFSINIHH